MVRTVDLGSSVLSEDRKPTSSTDYLAFRFGQDAGVAAMSWLAASTWAMGEVARAIVLADQMIARIAGMTHVGTLAFARLVGAMFGIMRDDSSRAAPNAAELVRLTREHDLTMHKAFAVFLEGWARTEGGAPEDGLENMRRGAELLRDQNILLIDGLLKIALAEAAARAGDVDRALAILDEALAMCDRIDHRTFDAELHRVRGEMLLKHNPAKPAPSRSRNSRERAGRTPRRTRAGESPPLDRPPRRGHAVLASVVEGFSDQAIAQLISPDSVIDILSKT